MHTTRTISLRSNTSSAPPTGPVEYARFCFTDSSLPAISTTNHKLDEVKTIARMARGMCEDKRFQGIHWHTPLLSTVETGIKPVVSVENP